MTELEELTERISVAFGFKLNEVLEETVIEDSEGGDDGT